jgi:hypothetical protein
MARVPDGHRTAERRSLALGVLVAERLDDALMARARERVQDWQRGDGAVPPVLADRWATVLAQGVEATRAALTGEDQLSVDLRQNSPFAGVVDPREWQAIVREVW